MTMYFSVCVCVDEFVCILFGFGMASKIYSQRYDAHKCLIEMPRLFSNSNRPERNPLSLNTQ